MHNFPLVFQTTGIFLNIMFPMKRVLGGVLVQTSLSVHQKVRVQQRHKLYNESMRLVFFVQALMVRKVKAYLCNLQVVDSESELDRLSLECEPQLNTGTLLTEDVQVLAQHQSICPNWCAGSVSNVSVGRKRMPSPSPSSGSSLSNASESRLRIAPAGTMPIMFGALLGNVFISLQLRQLH